MGSVEERNGLSCVAMQARPRFYDGLRCVAMQEPDREETNTQ